MQGVQALGANWVVFTPGWTYADAEPLMFGLAPEREPFWLDDTIMISQARAANLNVAIFPVARFAESPDEFWSGSARDASWWQSWFEHYRAFAVHHADLATQTGSQALILGGDWIGPALPGGQLADGSDSGVPADADLRWRAILTEVRQHFAGRSGGRCPLSLGCPHSPLAFLGETDGLYLLWDAPLAGAETASKSEMSDEAGRLLDVEVAPLQPVLDKPILLALAYPSTQGVRAGCPGQGGSCLPWQEFNQPNAPASGSVDLTAQADLYEAVLECRQLKALHFGRDQPGLLSSDSPAGPFGFDTRQAGCRPALVLVPPTDRSGQLSCRVPSSRARAGPEFSALEERSGAQIWDLRAAAIGQLEITPDRAPAQLESDLDW